jgi:hypothetical protein
MGGLQLKNKELEFGDYVAALITALIALVVMVLIVAVTIVFMGEANAGNINNTLPQNINAATVTTTGVITSPNVKGGQIVVNGGYLYLGTKTLQGVLLPSINSGFGASAVLAAGNGTALFTIDVNPAGSAASSGVVTIGSATTQWDCMAKRKNYPVGAGYTQVVTPTGTNRITITNYLDPAGTIAAFPTGLVLSLFCTGS